MCRNFHYKDKIVIISTMRIPIRISIKIRGPVSIQRCHPTSKRISFIQMRWSHNHCIFTHDDVIKWKHFPRNWPFVRGIHRSPVNSPHKGQWCGALMFSLICVWINNRVNNREAGDLRHYGAHYDIIVMQWESLYLKKWPLYWSKAKIFILIPVISSFLYNEAIFPVHEFAL